jgi:hypothetical protein
MGISVTDINGEWIDLKLSINITRGLFFICFLCYFLFKIFEI